MAILLWFVKSISQLCHAINTWLIFPALLLIVLADILLRTLFSSPVSWASEALGYLLLCAVFLSLPRCIQNRELLAVDFITHRLPPAVNKMLQRLAIFMMGAVAVLVMWQGATAVAEMWEYNERSYLLDLPLWPLSALIVLVGIECLLLSLLQLYAADLESHD